MRLSIASVALGMGMAWTGIAQSAPMYYGFKGSIHQVSSLAENPYDLGGAIKLAFLIDRDAPAYAIDEGATEVVPIEGSIPGEAFFAQWVGGNVTAQEPEVDYPFSYYFGYQSGDYSLFIGSNGNPAGADEIHVENGTVNISDWTVGMAGFKGSHRMLVGTSYISLADFDLSLYSITEEAPGWIGTAAVPEPGSLALLGMGVLFLGAAIRRRST